MMPEIRTTATLSLALRSPRKKRSSSAEASGTKGLAIAPTKKSAKARLKSKEMNRSTSATGSSSLRSLRFGLGGSTECGAMVEVDIDWKQQQSYRARLFARNTTSRL